MIKKVFKKIIKKMGYVQVSQFLQNWFRTRYATDMYISQCNVVTETHKQTFGEYKNKHCGQDIVIIATGPTLNNYKLIPNTINIGVNKAIQYNKVKFDYYFVQDFCTIKDCLNELSAATNIEKFYGILPLTAYGYKRAVLKQAVIPESIVLKHSAKKYYVYVKRPEKDYYFNVDIDKAWITDCRSIALSAAQFALFTNPRRIYLVGCDCSSGHYTKCFNETESLNHLVNQWKELKNFAEIYYPETEIISVNPVGLKGVFKDLYQDV